MLPPVKRPEWENPDPREERMICSPEAYQILVDAHRSFFEQQPLSKPKPEVRKWRSFSKKTKKKDNGK
jgi:hypothetical protein